MCSTCITTQLPHTPFLSHLKEYAFKHNHFMAIFRFEVFVFMKISSAFIFSIKSLYMYMNVKLVQITSYIYQLYFFLQAVGRVCATSCLPW